MIFSKLSVCGSCVDHMWRHLACTVKTDNRQMTQCTKGSTNSTVGQKGNTAWTGTS